MNFIDVTVHIPYLGEMTLNMPGATSVQYAAARFIEKLGLDPGEVHCNLRAQNVTLPDDDPIAMWVESTLRLEINQ